jgi:hypothetical protein
MADKVWLGSTSDNYSTTGNWLGGTPVATNNVFLTFGAINDILNGLNQSAVALASFNQDMGFVKNVGSLTAGVRSSLQINTPLATLGLNTPTGSPSGSGRLYLDFGAVATVVNVLNSKGQATDSYQTPVHLLGTSMTLNALGGMVGVATLVGEVSTLAALTVDGAIVVLGAGVTPTLINIISGSVVSSSTHTAPDVTVASTYVFKGAAAHTALKVLTGATVKYNGTGTIASLTYSGTVDFSEGVGAVTITNATRYPGGKILDPNKRVTFSNPVQDAGGAKATDDSSDFGPNRTWTVS